jgi:hypothetical protein
MVAAFVTSLTVQFGFHLNQSEPREFAYIVLATVSVTTIVWLAVTFLTKPEPKETLLAFYRRVRPSAALWGPIAREATDVIPVRDGVFNLVDWLLGVAMIYAFLFGAGKIIFDQLAMGLVFLASGLVLGGVIYLDLNRRGWKVVSS